MMKSTKSAFEVVVVVVVIIVVKPIVFDVTVTKVIV